MTRLTVLYTAPEDLSGFLDYYTGTHMPLADTVPGARWTITRFTGTPRGGEPTYVLKADAEFDSAEAMQAAMGSPEMGATGKDARAMTERFGNSAVMLLGEPVA